MPYETRCTRGRSSAKVRATKSCWNFSQRTRSTPLDNKTDVLVRFVLFGCIRDHLVALRNLQQNGLNWCQSLCHEVASEFFAMNAPDPPHLTLNFRFGAFRTFWVNSGPFGCLTKLGARRAEQVQNFVPQSRVGIFRNERTRSTALDPKLMYWCVAL